MKKYNAIFITVKTVLLTSSVNILIIKKKIRHYLQIYKHLSKDLPYIAAALRRSSVTLRVSKTFLLHSHNPFGISPALCISMLYN